MNNEVIKMYFPENYLSDDLKEFLLHLKIVEEIKIPEQFKDIKEPEFINFMETEFEIPCQFSWIENDKLNDWTIELIEKLNDSNGKDEDYKQKLYKLVDILVFDKCLKEYNNYCNPFERTGIDGFTGFSMPILCKDRQYRICNKHLIFNVDEKYYNETVEFKSLISDDKYNNSHYADYVGLKDFRKIIPYELEFDGATYDEKYPLNFWRWVWECNNDSNDNLYLSLFEKIYQGINDESRYSDRDSAQRFLMDLVSKHYNLLDEAYVVHINESVAKDYFKIIDTAFGKSLKFKIDKNSFDKLDEIIDEIKKQIQFAEKHDEIESWFDNIVIIEKGKNEESYTRMYTQNLEKVLVLSQQNNFNKYRENIASFLKNCFNISLEKKDFTITPINNKNAYKTEPCTQDDFNQLKQSNDIFKFDKDKYREELKRFFMEPLRFQKKYFSGYAKTCPFCGRVVETQMTSMRIKTVRLNEKQIEVICCSTCADLFNYCDDNPKIEIVKGNTYSDENRIEDMKKMLEDIESKIRLKFFIEPEYLAYPFVVEFEPRAAQRYWIVKTLQS